MSLVIRLDIVYIRQPGKKPSSSRTDGLRTKLLTLWFSTTFARFGESLRLKFSRDVLSSVESSRLTSIACLYGRFFASVTRATSSSDRLGFQDSSSLAC